MVVQGFAKDTGSANVYCVNEVARALREYAGAEVTVLGDTLKQTKAGLDWKRHPVFAAKKIKNWPIMDPNASEECYLQIIAELEKTEYDAILVSHMPYDAVLAAVRAKKKYPKTVLMLYELDPITYEIDRARKSLGRYLYFMRERAERKTFKACDVLLHMECNRAKYSQSEYDKYTDKCVYLDFPLIHDLGIVETQPRELGGATVKLLYTGKLMEHFRSPEYLLKTIVAAHEQIDLEIAFFSNGNCETMLQEYAEKYPFIKQMGFVERERLESEIDSCDCLVNIGNKISDMLPSKLLNYIETGKPIVHIQNQAKDACLPYLERYGSAVVISEEDPVERSAGRLAEFLRLHYGQMTGSERIVREFAKNTAEYSARTIVEAIRERIK